MTVKSGGSSLYHFPLLYEGDCFYDILARFSEGSGHLRGTDVSRELFGNCPDLRSSITFPYRAELIYTWLGTESNISMETLRDNHSAWQYIQMSEEMSSKAMDTMRQERSRPGKRLAKMTSLIQSGVSHLRYCPHCMVRDYLTVGEPFWHQVHQIHGVKLCPVHGIPLQDSKVSLTKRLDEYVPASKALSNLGIEEGLSQSAALAEQRIPFKAEYLSLAKTIDRLLRFGLRIGGQDELFRKYAHALHWMGYPPTGEDFLEPIHSLGGRAFLEDFYPDGTYEAEMAAFKKKKAKAFTPLEHALIITSLDISF